MLCKLKLLLMCLLALGMVLVQSESGQLLMIPQQALAQMQAQAQGGGAPRTATPTNVSPVQVRSLLITRAFVISVNVTSETTSYTYSLFKHLSHSFLLRKKKTYIIYLITMYISSKE